MNKEDLKEIILEIVSTQVPQNNAYSLAAIGYELKKRGFDVRRYGFDKLSQFFDLLTPFVKVIRDETKKPPVIYIEIDSSQDISEIIDKVLENEISVYEYKESLDRKIFEALAEDYRPVRKITFYNLLTMILAISITMFFVLKLPNLISDKDRESGFAKTVKQDIVISIRNGAPIEVVKNIYNLAQNNPIKNRVTYDIFSFLWDDSKSKKEAVVYPMNTTLSRILEECRKDYYVNNNNEDSMYLHRLNSLISQNSQTNPFEGLDPNQKFLFENIRQKLDSSYIKVEPEINKLTDEMKNRNQLVNEYLSQSSISFTISIIALIFSLIISAYQIYQSYKSGKNIVRSIEAIREMKI